MIPKTVDDLADAICEIEKELQYLKTRTDEKFIGIDGRLKATDIKISESLVSFKDSLSVKLAEGGGMALHFSKATNDDITRLIK